MGKLVRVLSSDLAGPYYIGSTGIITYNDLTDYYPWYVLFGNDEHGELIEEYFEVWELEIR